MDVVWGSAPALLRADPIPVKAQNVSQEWKWLVGRDGSLESLVALASCNVTMEGQPLRRDSEGSCPGSSCSRSMGCFAGDVPSSSLCREPGEGPAVGLLSIRPCMASAPQGAIHHMLLDPELWEELMLPCAPPDQDMGT